MGSSPLLTAITSLPATAATASPNLAAKCDGLLSVADAEALDQVFITGCGDSHHAAVAAALVFRLFSGLFAVTALPAMSFARYHAAHLPSPEISRSLVIGISVSGQVSRTIEALQLAEAAGATTLAITGNPDGELAQVAQLTLLLDSPPSATITENVVVPGASSYITSLLALFQLALRMGLLRGRLTQAAWLGLQQELDDAAGYMDATILSCDRPAADLVQLWADASHFVYCGSGPNYGTALFSSAKLLEASGDIALAQDMEEWSHLDYFSRDPATPTLLISAAARDDDRALEISTAAEAIGRRLAIIAPTGSALSSRCQYPGQLSYSGRPRECFSPLVSCLPGLLIAANRSQLLDEPYFRGFGGGRSIEGGGGISRIRSSHRLLKLRP